MRTLPPSHSLRHHWALSAIDASCGFEQASADDRQWPDELPNVATGKRFITHYLALANQRNDSPSKVKRPSSTRAPRTSHNPAQVKRMPSETCIWLEDLQRIPAAVNKSACSTLPPRQASVREHAKAFSRATEAQVCRSVYSIQNKYKPSDSLRVRALLKKPEHDTQMRTSCMSSHSEIAPARRTSLSPDGLLPQSNPPRSADMASFSNASSPRDGVSLLCTDGAHWSVDDSIWSPRAALSDSKQLTDSIKCARKAMHRAWIAASPHLTKLFNRARLSPEQLTALEQELLNHSQLFLALFDYYAACHPTSVSGGNISHINQISYESFVEELHLVNPKNPSHVGFFPRLFFEVTLSCDECSTPSLDRQQFLQVLFHASATCFADSHLLSAVRRLFAHIHAHAPPQVLHLPNCFRESACYTEGVDRVLRAHEQMLRRIFAAFSSADLPFAEVDSMGLQEWLKFLRDLDLIDVHFSALRATTCFVLSRMRQVEFESPKSIYRSDKMNFYDFLEALVRVSTMKALPTWDELRDSGTKNAGSFFLLLRQKSPGLFDKFIADNTTVFGSSPRQPVAHCVQRLLEYVVFTVDQTASCNMGTQAARLLQLGRPNTTPARSRKNL